MTPAFALAGLYLHLTVTDPTGAYAPGIAILHVEANGTLGVSCPFWAHAQDIAIAAVPLIAAATAALGPRAADPDAWPPRPTT